MELVKEGNVSKTVEHEKKQPDFHYIITTPKNLCCYKVYKADNKNVRWDFFSLSLHC